MQLRDIEYKLHKACIWSSINCNCRYWRKERYQMAIPRTEADTKAVIPNQEYKRICRKAFLKIHILGITQTKWIISLRLGPGVAI